MKATNLFQSFTSSLIPASLICLIASLPVPLTASADDKPSQTPMEVGAQVEMTHDSIEQLLRKIGSGDATSGYKAGDYWRSLPGFKAPIGAATTKFEDDVKNTILPKVTFWVNRYNAIVNSTDFSDEQKKALLAQQLPQIKSQIALVSKEYQAAIDTLYRAVDLPYDVSVTNQDIPTNNGETTFNQDCVGVEWNSFKHAKQFRLTTFEFGNTNSGHVFKDYSCAFEKASYEMMDTMYLKSINAAPNTQDNLDMMITNHWDSITIMSKLLALPDLAQIYFTRTTYPTISQGCQSQICLGLRASDLATFVGLSNKTLDRDLVIPLADGQTVTLTALHRDISLVSVMLTNTSYPGTPLPFDSN